MSNKKGHRQPPPTGSIFMFFFILILFVGLFSAIVLIISHKQDSTPTPPFSKEWKRPSYRKFKTFSLAVKEAQQLGRPIFLDLYADWCHPCKKLERETFSHPSIKALLDQYLVVKFNIDKPEGRGLVRRFRVSRFPTTLMLNKNGAELERVVGFFPPKFFRPAVHAALTNQNRYNTLWWKSKKSPNALKLKLKLADRLLLRRGIIPARNLYSELLRLDPTDSQGVGARGLFGIARSWTRTSKYAKALPFLRRVHQLFPKSEARIDAYRMQLYCLDQLATRGASRRFRRRYRKRFRRISRIFRRRYRGTSTRFE